MRMIPGRAPAARGKHGGIVRDVLAATLRAVNILLLLLPWVGSLLLLGMILRGPSCAAWAAGARREVIMPFTPVPAPNRVGPTFAAIFTAENEDIHRFARQEKAKVSAVDGQYECRHLAGTCYVNLA